MNVVKFACRRVIRKLEGNACITLTLPVDSYILEGYEIIVEASMPDHDPIGKL